MASGDAVAERQGSTGDPSRPDIVLLFYIGVPAITAMLFAMNKAGMARILQAPGACRTGSASPCRCGCCWICAAAGSTWCSPAFNRIAGCCCWAAR
jgi:hypothetical protein